MSLLIRYLALELKTICKKPALMMESLVFFVIVTSLFPIAIEPDLGLLQKMAPGVILVSLLFVVMLQCQMQLHQEYEEGTIEQLITAPCSLSTVVLAKILSLVFALSLPIGFVIPILTYVFGATECSLTWLGVLLLVIPIVVFVSFLGASLTLGLKRENILLSVLIMPLLVPVLIFGAGAMQAAQSGMIIVPLCVLGAFLVLCFGFLPHVIAGVLRLSHG